MQENTNGTFERIKPFTEFMKNMAGMGPDDYENIRAFHFGTESELKEIREKKSLEHRLNDIEADVKELKGKDKRSKYFIFPTDEEVKKYASKGPIERNMLKIMAGIAQK